MPLGRGLFWIVQMTLVHSYKALQVLAKAPLRIPSRQFTRLHDSRNTARLGGPPPGPLSTLLLFGLQALGPTPIKINIAD